MSTYSLRIARVVGSYNETPLVMIDVTITNDNGRFYEGAMPYSATARDATTTVQAFMAFLSPNGKQLHAFFTTDAFSVFPGPFHIDFGTVARVIGTIENIDIAVLVPLAPDYVAFGLPDADNAWLSTLG